MVAGMTQVRGPDEQGKRGMGMFAGFWLLVGLACLGVSALSALNTAFDLNLALGSYGAQTALPSHWEEVAGLTMASLLIIGLSLFGSKVANLFRDAKGRPLVRAGITAGAIFLLAVVGRGLQIVALTSTYGSMLAYYCTEDGTLDDVKGELEDGATPEELDRCLSRTAQWDRHDLLETVIGAGANFRDESSEAEYRHCVLASDVSLAYVNKAIALGAKPGACGSSDAMIWERVRFTRPGGDEKTAEIVKVLLEAGWSPEARREGEEKSALELAREDKLEKTVAVLEGAAG
jgi:hypothetical protein